MATSRALRSWSLVMCVSVFVACGDDDEPPPPAGKSGTGGTAGRGGSSGRGGMTGSGGGMNGSGGGGMGGGMNGSGGVSGTGGRDASAGTAGSAGTNGSSGSAGTAGSDASAGTAGMAGNDAGDGAAGADASSDAADAGFRGLCIESCTSDDQCRIGDAANSGYGCRNNRCAFLSTYCATADSECIAGASNWTFPCANSAACPTTFPMSCVDIGGGVGRCAFNQGAIPCGAAPANFPMPVLGGDGGTATVCGDNTMRCDTATRSCRLGCQNTSDCPPMTGCNTTTHMCGCINDGQCTGRPGVSACNEATGICECTQNSDCDAVEGDVCVNGRCGCSGISACTHTFNGTTEACQAP